MSSPKIQTTLGIAFMFAAAVGALTNGHPPVAGSESPTRALSDTLQAIPTNLMELMVDWLTQHPEASLEEASHQANVYLRRFGWPFTFDIGHGTYPGNEEVLRALRPDPSKPSPASRAAPFFVSAPDSGRIIALQIQVPQSGLLITGSGDIDVPIVSITGRSVDLRTNAGLTRMELPATFSFGQLTILDETLTSEFGMWPMEFNGRPPWGISRDATKVYFCTQLPKSVEAPERAILVSNWWRRAGGDSYALRLFGERVSEPFLILALSRDGVFSFEFAFEELTAQKVERVPDSPTSDDLVYWRFVFDDGLVYVMGWPGIIT